MSLFACAAAVAIASEIPYWFLLSPLSLLVLFCHINEDYHVSGLIGESKV
jgi:hypothetical protein